MITHGYLVIDLERIWSIVDQGLPGFKVAVVDLLSERW